VKKLFLLASLLALGMGTVSRLRTDRFHQSSISSQTVAQATDGAYRDGLHLGRLAAECGAPPHVASGRWATAEDRASFAAGYQRAFSEFPASQEASATGSRRAR
jgi:hypothetical protein